MGKEIMENLTVVKRSGQRVEFDSLKIAAAIKKAFDSMPSSYDKKQINKVYEQTINYITENYQNRKTINVEEIQDIIENVLNNNNLKEVADDYASYRLKRNLSRKSFAKKQQHKFVKAIEKIAEVDAGSEKPNITLEKFGQIICNQYTKSYVMDNKYIRAMNEGRIYVHNFDYFNFGYLSFTNIKIDKLILNENCFFDIINLLTQAKKEIKEEILIDSIDSLFGKYILNRFKENLKETIYRYLNITGFVDLINFKKINEKISREISIQINFDDYREIFKNDYLISIFKNAYNDTLHNIKKKLSINIEKLLITLNDFDKYSISLGGNLSKEALIVQDIILDKLNNMQPLKNVCVIYKIDKNISENTIIEISNLIKENKNIKLNFLENKEENCEYFTNGYKIYENIYSQNISTGRMNVSNTSINLARLGIKHKKLNKDFYDELDSLIEFTKNELLFVFENLGDKQKDNYQYIFNNNIFDDEKLDCGQKIRKVIKNGTLNINLIGLKECAFAIDKEKYNKIILDILIYLRKKIEDFSKDNRLNFTLSCTKENASYEFADFDKTIYGLIDDVTKKDFYENIAKLDETIDFSILNKYSKILSGGFKLDVHLNKNVSSKKICDLINELKENYKGLAHFMIGCDTK